MDSILAKYSQVQDLYSIFQVPPQQEEPIDLEKSMKYMSQSQNSLNQSINMLEPQVSHLVNTNDKEEETLPTQSLTIHDFPNHIDRDQESLCLENFNQDSISLHHLELDQYQTIHKLASFHFNEVELDWECDTDPQFCDSVPLFESILTPVFLSDLDEFPSQH